MLDRLSSINMAEDLSRENELDNPTILQPELYADFNFFSGSTPPVIFIHDGGGTVFPYFCLGRLHRFAYGIANPNFTTGESFAGGLAEMGRLYAGWVQDLVLKDDFPAKMKSRDSIDILLAGWSLGGLLSLEVARILDADVRINIIGIVMIDSIYPSKTPPGNSIWSPTEPKSKNDFLSKRSMAVARQMLVTWSIPIWGNDAIRRRPDVVLIRARDAVKMEKNDTVHRVDGHRGDRILGWGEYDPNLFKNVLDLDGQHFDLFDEERIKGTTAAIRKALMMFPASDPL